jgi:hypothetical protein
MHSGELRSGDVVSQLRPRFYCRYLRVNRFDVPHQHSHIVQNIVRKALDNETNIFTADIFGLRTRRAIGRVFAEQRICPLENIRPQILDTVQYVMLMLPVVMVDLDGFQYHVVFVVVLRLHLCLPKESQMLRVGNKENALVGSMRHGVGPAKGVATLCA